MSTSSKFKPQPIVFTSIPLIEAKYQDNSLDQSKSNISISQDDGQRFVMWSHSVYEKWLLSLPALIPYMVMMSLKMMERKTPFTSETFLPEYDYIVGKFIDRTRWGLELRWMKCSRGWLIRSAIFDHHPIIQTIGNQRTETRIDRDDRALRACRLGYSAIRRSSMAQIHQIKQVKLFLRVHNSGAPS